MSPLDEMLHVTVVELILPGFRVTESKGSFLKTQHYKITLVRDHSQTALPRFQCTYCLATMSPTVQH